MYPKKACATRLMFISAVFEVVTKIKEQEPKEPLVGMWKSCKVEICELQKELLRIGFVFEVKSLRLELLAALLASMTCAGKRLIGRRLAIF